MSNNLSAAQILDKIQLPLPTMERKKYRKWLIDQLQDDLKFPLPQMRALMKHFDCGINELVDELVDHLYKEAVQRVRAEAILPQPTPKG